MSATRKSVNANAAAAATVIDRSQQFHQAPLLWAIGLVGMVMISAFAVVYSSHVCRTLYSDLQLLESTQWQLQEDYGRLLLEQSTWASHYRVESVARQDLKMQPPQLGRLKVVHP